jgi:mannose-6-phosphate isomerase-like protein (cupin superfamily)
MRKNATTKMIVARAKPAAKAPARRQAKAALKTAVVPKRPPALVTGAKPPMPTQRFTVSHLREEDFKGGGLRDYAVYRDLDVAAATTGLAQAHVIRLTRPWTPDVGKWHYHSVTFQLIYVLKGWIRGEFDGYGEHVFRAGSCWLQPPGIKHSVRDYSDDVELLEIILPADFETVTLK